MGQLTVIEQARALIAAGDIVGAEHTLVALADTQGDGALVEVLAQLPPKDTLAIIREYDDARETIINHLLTPRQFAQAVVIEKQYRDLSRRHLRGMMNAVIFREGGAPMAFLNAIGDTEGGAQALADYFEERWSRVEAFARSGVFDTVEDTGDLLSEDEMRERAWERARLDEDEVADRDWMQLAWLLRYQNPDLFIEMLLTLRSKARAFELGLIEHFGEDEDDRIETRQAEPGRITQAAIDPDEESAI